MCLIDQTTKLIRSASSSRKRAESPSVAALKRTEGVFWDHKLYVALSRINLDLVWSVVEFQEQEHGAPGGEAILAGA